MEYGSRKSGYVQKEKNARNARYCPKELWNRTVVEG